MAATTRNSTLVTAQEVITFAFPGNTNMVAASINNVVIHVAEQKYILPAVGKAMFEKLYTAVEYRDFVENHIKRALAYFVKCEVLPSLSIQLSNAGAAVFNGQHSSPATDKQRQLLYDSEMSKAKTLLAEAVQYINEHLTDFPDYNPEEHCAPKPICAGGFLII